MKNIDGIKWMLTELDHKNCLFHCILESKKRYGVICVRNHKRKMAYKSGETVLLFGFGDPLTCSLDIRDFYLLMLGKIQLPEKLKTKEIWL